MGAEKICLALEYASSVFSPGTVWTDLVMGHDSQEYFKDGIDRLIDSGVLPLILLQRESEAQDSTYPNLVELADHMDEAIQRNGLPLKWLYPACRFLSPLDTRFFTEDPLKARLAVIPVYRSGFGKRTSAGFAAIRRKLRIRNVKDSFESAGL